MSVESSFGEADESRPSRFPLLARVAPLLAGILLAAVLVALSRRPYRAYDTYFHLRFGEQFRSDWSVADPGQLSVASTNDWVPTQWLPQIVMSWIADQAGTGGLILVFAATVVAFVGAVHLMLRARVGCGPAIALTIVVFIGCLPSVSLRPQVLSYILFVIVIAAHDHARRRGSVPWLLIPVCWLWAMVHGMWILGVCTSLVLAIAVCIEQRASRGEVVRRLAVPVLMLITVLLTPAGPRILGAVVLVNSRAEHFHEWRSPELATLGAAPVTVLLFLAVLLMVRRTSASPYDIALLAIGSAMAIYSHRTLPLALIALAAVVAHEWTHRRQESTPKLNRFELGTVVALGVAVVALASTQQVAGDSAEQVRPYLTELRTLPPGAVVLTDRSTGGVLLWEAPKLDIPIHGYGDVYTDQELDEYDDLERLAPGWQETLSRLNPQIALLPSGEPLAYALEEHGWTTTGKRGDLVLLTPGTP